MACHGSGRGAYMDILGVGSRVAPQTRGVTKRTGETHHPRRCGVWPSSPDGFGCMTKGVNLESELGAGDSTKLRPEYLARR
jgi:hypothetical protein